MPQVKFAQGYVKEARKPVGNDNVKDWHDAQKTIAKDLDGGYDSELGLLTIKNATTGEIMGLYITGNDPYTIVVEPLETARANAKALLIARS